MTWTLPTPTGSDSQALVQTLPRWIVGTRLGSVLTVIARCSDIVADYVEAAVKLWFPGFYSTETLARIGRERRIVRGPLEPAASYSARLAQWRQTRKRAGGWAVLLEQLRAYWNGTISGGIPVWPEIWIIANNGQSVIMSALNGQLAGDTPAWSWDEHSPGGGGVLWPSRYWVLIIMPQGIDPQDQGMLFGSSGKTGNGRKFGYQIAEGSDPSLGIVRRIGTDATSEQVATIRGIVQQWNPPHAYCEAIIVSWNAPAAWYPGGPGAQPDGHWNLRQNREPTLNYWPGTR